MSSSSVRITRTATRLCSEEITLSFAAFRLSSNSIQGIPAVTNPDPDCGRVLSNAPSEHQRVHSTQRRCKCANPFLDLVAEEPTASAARTSALRLEQIAHVGTGSDMPSNPDWRLTISLNCFALMFSVRARYQTSPGSRSRTSAHRHPGRRREAHACVDGFAVTHRRQARAIARWAG